jgi:hypothetical protein
VTIKTTGLRDDFCADGVLAVRGAFGPDVVRGCVEAIEAELRRHGVDPRDPGTWTQPVVRIACPEGARSRRRSTPPALAEAYDALLAAGRWVRRAGVGGGTVPIRFPSPRGPGDVELAHRRQLRRGRHLVGQRA